MSIDTNVLATLPMRDHADLQIPAFDMPSDCETDGGVEGVERSVLHRDARLLNQMPGYRTFNASYSADKNAASPDNGFCAA